ncbi:unnamed protein product [Absidia cylindrospora]
MTVTTTTTTTTISSDPPLQGRVDTLTDDQTMMLKQIWRQLLVLFQQKGDSWTPPPLLADNDTTSQKSSSSIKKKKKKKSKKSSHDEHGFETNLFIGKTSNPAWTSLGVEEAIPLIPGHLLHMTFWNMVTGDNPDCVVLRYLRARKWDVDAAYIMLLNTLRWRIYMRVDDVSALGESGMVRVLEELKPGMGEQFYYNVHSNKTVLGGPDNAGRGICYVNARFHRKEDQDLEVIKLLTVYVMELSRMIVHQPVESACIVFNMEGFTLANMDFEFTKFLLHCFESYYPETLGSCLIHKVPWVFSTVWAMITPLLDPVVASKIRFTKTLQELSQHVDMAILPPFLTGKETIKVDNGVEASLQRTPPPEGTLKRPMTPEVLDYNTMVEEYQYQTSLWAAQPSSKASDPERKQLALMYRHATINAELYLRGRTSYHELGLAGVEKGRLLLKYLGKVPTLDITDSV